MANWRLSTQLKILKAGFTQVTAVGRHHYCMYKKNCYKSNIEIQYINTKLYSTLFSRWYLVNSSVTCTYLTGL